MALVDIINGYNKRIEELEKEMADIDEKIDKYREYVKLHPEKKGVEGNIKALIYARDRLCELYEITLMEYIEQLKREKESLFPIKMGGISNG